MMLRWLQQRVQRGRGERRAPNDWSPHTGSERPRVLLEYPSFATPWVAADLLRRAGCEPLICEGPGDSAGVCRLLNTGECSLVRDADVVYNAFGLGTEEHRAIIGALRHRYPDTPVVVETTRPSAEKHADMLGECVLCEAPATSRKMTGAIASALAGP